MLRFFQASYKNAHARRLTHGLPMTKDNKCSVRNFARYYAIYKIIDYK